ncbi:hypothetical protein Y032_0204g1907 [Ancylostoma ceylanicum]|uniref:Activin types I and II receptor domain-containing protein n=1 Tax=Ancylostoma ceylanicum TaxID=53326 RepID=A0A016SLR2_9BILA|nr:hypothetical protein Y032_0204g1907 [Ancylostoma ceylanicum]
MRLPIAFSLVLASVASLECHLGYSILRGSTIGEATKKCGKDTDFCYNATAEIFSLTTLQKAGCNTLLCQFVPNSCYQRKILGIPVTFCCCKNEDLCNRGQMTMSSPSLQRNAEDSTDGASLE